jgi:hypothetical protein
MLSHSIEEQLEVVVTLRRDNDALRTATAHANQLLDSPATLLTVGSQEDPFASVFASLRSTFRFHPASRDVHARSRRMASEVSASMTLTMSSGRPDGSASA